MKHLFRSLINSQMRVLREVEEMKQIKAQAKMTRNQAAEGEQEKQELTSTNHLPILAVIVFPK
ncbi:hypothetical protein M438DRAFT_343563 [Aureobasidium pullulans EXF-150]|uniref:Uncharacterized protein n=1 Tax=Aureobasidium pullulans EXF-150 TaxID=1043002 RepID=A0A074XNS1_AURPU|nr:uncharacterized protein M438DRAFT_343563 [Aureobasidium pullulans EXF-150]KEQ87188.1 hypothetical protein M438DRAFT_343563 [Aureobasidium pullulans EXF-150]